MFTIAVDIGGTFTDVFVVDEEIKRTFISKTATTPDDLLVGVMTGLDEVAAQMGLNIEKHSLDKVIRHPKIQQRLIGLNALSEKCLECRHRLTCGGGYFPHRYSKKNGFKNPSVYCEDYLMLFDHITSRLKEELN